MVWWMHYNASRHRNGVHFGLKTDRDIVYQTINIMYDCHDQNYDGYDIHSLTYVGVNIFNVDLTKHDVEFFHKIKAAMEFSHNLPEIIPSAYYTPVGLSVTMSANNPIDIDERVDIIILKDVMTTDQFREFKKQNIKFSSMPILLWPSTLKIEDLNELIKISDGIVLDPSLSNIFNGSRYYLQKCKEARKPVFFMNPSIIEDYYEDIANDRQLLIQIHEIIENRLDGIFLVDRRGKPPIELIQALVRATEIIEKEFLVAIDYYKTSFSLQTPVLQPYAAALAASLAALQCGARAIIVFSTTGASARLLSCAAPPCRVIAVTRYEKTARRMHLYRKVIPLHYREKRACRWQDESLARVVFGTQFGLDTGLFDFGAKLVVLAPAEEGGLYCNSFKIASVGHILNTSKCVYVCTCFDVGFASRSTDMREACIFRLTYLDLEEFCHMISVNPLKGDHFSVYENRTPINSNVYEHTS